MPKNDLHLRVVSGEFRGRSLISPNSEQTHPMGAREKLALFNQIEAAGQTVLDLYAGTGALGIEALSRGAKSVTFVEKSPKIAQVLRQNLENLGISAPVKVVVDTVEQFLQTDLATGSQKFDLILADPPYEHVRPEVIAEFHLFLKPGGMLVLSSPARLPAPELPGLELAGTHTYASARISRYQQSRISA